MKFESEKPMPRGVKRTLAAFVRAMKELLAEKSFESLSVQEICSRADYPRSTFYNYFDDKYDLLQFGLQELFEKVGLKEYAKMEYGNRLYVFYERVYDLMQENAGKIRRILRHNPLDGVLFTSLRKNMFAQIRTYFSSDLMPLNPAIPADLLSGHFGNTLLWVLEWIFQDGMRCSKEQGEAYLHLLLDGVKERMELPENAQP